MISFDNLPLAPGTLISLSKINIDFVFQPIMHIQTGDILAYEAFVEQYDTDALTVIDQYEVNTKSHTLELATLFGAVKRFRERGYSEKLCINSFASEILDPHETTVFFDHLSPDMHGRLIFDLINHNYYSPLTWQIKRNQLRWYDVQISMDDFSPNFDHIQACNIFEPNYIKLDRSYIEDVCWDRYVQDRLYRTIEFYHNRKIKIIISGIETEKEYTYIKKTAADYVQGNYFGKPM